MFLSQYANVFRRHGALVGFGFLMAFISSGGQTYFVAIFGPQIQETFELSHTEWSSFYLIGTLASALILPWSGQFIDRLNLKLYTIIVVLGLALACGFMSLASSPVFIIIGIFLLRHTGQGLSSHISVTTMARYLNKDRGKGIALSSMGYAVGEAALPVLAVVTIAVIGWRQTYFSAGVIVMILLLLAVWLLKDQTTSYPKPSDHADPQTILDASNVISVSRNDMLRERRFYFIVLPVIVVSLVQTALFFHHLNIAHIKQWSGTWVTGNYWVYALSSIVTSFIAGPCIDRFTAVKIAPLALFPICIALGLLIPAQHPLWVVPYMVLLGMTSGLNFTALSALWAELYGPQYLGAIKSTIGAIGVFATALGPVTIGVLLDLQVSFAMLCSVLIAMCLGASASIYVGLRK